MKIEIGDLRIGNFVTTDDIYFQVESLQSKNHWENNYSNFDVNDIEIDLIDNNGDGSYCELKYLKGIPIDEQWLFKFEFAILSKSEYISEYSKYFNFRIFKCRIVKNLVFVFIDDHEICMLEYVHQLQNLFYVIAGKELKTT